jgi:hypothetical protein
MGQIIDQSSKAENYLKSKMLYVHTFTSSHAQDLIWKKKDKKKTEKTMPLFLGSVESAGQCIKRSLWRSQKLGLEGADF